MGLSELLNLLLGGGLLASVVGIITLKATVRKANAEAEKARAEAETVRIDNAEHATRVLIDNIVAPLQNELRDVRADLKTTTDELRDTKKALGATKREMARLRRAVESAARCPYSADCPVLRKLRDGQKGGDQVVRLPGGGEGQPDERDAPDGDEDASSGGGGDGDSPGQPAEASGRGRIPRQRRGPVGLREHERQEAEDGRRSCRV